MKIPICIKMWFGYKIKDVFELVKVSDKDPRLLEYYMLQGLPYKPDNFIVENWMPVAKSLKKGGDDCEGLACVVAQVLNIWGWSWTVYIISNPHNPKIISHAVTVFQWPFNGKYCFSSGVLRKYDNLLELFPKYTDMEIVDPDFVKSLFDKG